MLKLESEKGWVEFTSPIFSSDGQKMLFVKSEDQGNGLGAYRHIVIFNKVTQSINPITRGAFTVVDILGWDQNKNEM